jgi:hypothetical protein
MSACEDPIGEKNSQEGYIPSYKECLNRTYGYWLGDKWGRHGSVKPRIGLWVRFNMHGIGLWARLNKHGIGLWVSFNKHGIGYFKNKNNNFNF